MKKPFFGGVSTTGTPPFFEIIEFLKFTLYKYEHLFYNIVQNHICSGKVSFLLQFMEFFVRMG